MEKIEYFDYPKVAKKMNVPSAILKKIEKEVKHEFPKDKMMYELHVLRALRACGKITSQIAGDRV